jgi:hypothetical protein
MGVKPPIPAHLFKETSPSWVKTRTLFCSTLRLFVCALDTRNCLAAVGLRVSLVNRSCLTCYRRRKY